MVLTHFIFLSFLDPYKIHDKYFLSHHLWAWLLQDMLQKRLALEKAEKEDVIKVRVIVAVEYRRKF